ncbi:hypothetical protein NRY95_01065 [Xanthomonas campestris pv. phormiicola]|nr:hypothetical protein [Xanthomonas campestris pv. phormiicola]UYC16605.1 hypothetical protein NRY95_01065 [Xanthomonas campestris pv. phormiicola]
MIVLILGFSGEAFGNVVVGRGKINYVENGWFGEGLVIHFSQNGPPGCSASLNDLAIDKNHAAYKELVAMAIAAYTSDSNVELMVEDGTCLFGGRTKILSIRLVK